VIRFAQVIEVFCEGTPTTPIVECPALPMTPAILDRLRGVQRSGSGCLAFCPAHPDQHKRSLSVGVGDDGKTQLAECAVRAEGLPPSVPAKAVTLL